MRISTLFSILSLFVITPMAIHLGEKTDWLWINGAGSRDAIESACAMIFIIGCLALWYRLSWMSIDSDRQERGDFNHMIIMGLTTMLSAFCFSYLYAFTVAPIKNGVWFDGWLIYMVIGLLPVIMELNCSVGEIIKNRSARSIH